MSDFFPFVGLRVIWIFHHQLVYQDFMVVFHQGAFVSIFIKKCVAWFLFIDSATTFFIGKVKREIFKVSP